MAAWLALYLYMPNRLIGMLFVTTPWLAGFVFAMWLTSYGERYICKSRGVAAEPTAYWPVNRAIRTVLWTLAAFLTVLAIAGEITGAGITWPEQALVILQFVVVPVRMYVLRTEISKHLNSKVK